MATIGVPVETAQAGRLRSIATRLQGGISKHGGVGGLLGKGLYAYGIGSTLNDIVESSTTEGFSGFKGAATRAAVGWGPWLGLDYLGRKAAAKAPGLLAKAALKKGASKLALTGAARAAGLLGSSLNPVLGIGLMTAPVWGPMAWHAITGKKSEEPEDERSEYNRLSPYEKNLVMREMYKRKMQQRQQQMQLLENYDYGEYEE